jgi:hypothetical protein
VPDDGSRRHAVEAAQVAAVGDGETEIGDGAGKSISYEVVLLLLLVVME